ncbi:hypothetical protein V6Z11_A06G045100 [Gossypium hirsutum]
MRMMLIRFEAQTYLLEHTFIWKTKCGETFPA